MSGRSRGEGARWQRYRRPETDDIEREPAAGPAALPRRRPARRTSGRPGRLRRPGRLAGWVGVAAGVAYAGSAILSAGGEQAPAPLPREERYAPIVTDEALAEVGAALARQSGGTEVLEARFGGTDDILLTTPPATPGDLAEVWRWDGTVLEKWLGEQARDRSPFDLGAVDAEVLRALDEEARERSDGRISSSRAHVRKPVTDTEHWVYLRVSEVDHGGVVLWADLAGTIESDLVNESWRDD
ncbi:hypothetical protein ACJ5H2_20480 [Nocardioides sp. R1-1]|uniref:hypothetical protein n=1 Tax=Nocardioides sp. R1-1 TaxID=3383502 RepID=UPI0038CFC959